MNARAGTLENEPSVRQPYPRANIVRRIRELARYSWAAWFAYVGIAARNLFALVREDGLHALTQPDRAGYALLVPQVLSAPAYVIAVLVALVVTAVVVFIAQRDVVRERSYRSQQKALRSERAVREIVRRGFILRTLDMIDEHRDLQRRRWSDECEGPPSDDALFSQHGELSGRDIEREWLKQRLSAPGVTIVSGPPGTGKGALAAAVIRDLRAGREDMGTGRPRFVDGVGVVLCGTRPSTEIVRRALARFSPYRRWPDTESLDSLVSVARQTLSHHDALIVLEDVRDASQAVAAAQVLATTDCPVLVLCREEYRDSLPAEFKQLQLENLPIKEGVELLLKIAGGHQHGDGLQREVATHVVEVLEGHALAITVVGSYAASEHLALDSLVTLLGEIRPSARYAKYPRGVALALTLALSPMEFSGSGGPAATAKSRQQEWTLLVRCGAFATEEFSWRSLICIGEAARLANPPQHIEALIAHGLMFRWDKEAKRGDVPIQETLHAADWKRLRLHSLIRDIACEEFRQWPITRRDQVSRTLAQYYADYAVNRPGWVLAWDQENIAGAIRWAHARHGRRLIALLCAAMCRFWLNRWRSSEWAEFLPWGIKAARKEALHTNRPEDWLRLADLELAATQADQRAALINPDEAEQRLRANLDTRRERHDRSGEAEVLMALGKLERQRQRLSHAEAYFQSALDIARELSDAQLESSCIGFIGRIQQARGDFAEASESYQRSKVLAEEAGDLVGHSQVLFQMSQVARAKRDWANARRYVDESLSACQTLGDLHGVAQALWQRGLIAYDLHQFDDAQRDFQDSLDLRRELRDVRGEGMVLGSLSRIALDRGDLSEAESRAQDALAIGKRVQDLRAQAVNLAQLGRIESRRGHLDQAEGLFREALEACEKIPHLRGVAANLFELGRLAKKADDEKSALDYYLRALRTAEEADDLNTKGLVLYALGQLMREDEQYERAEHYYASALEVDRLLQDDKGVAVALALLAQIALARGDTATAEQRYREGLQISREVHEPDVESLIASSLGELVLRNGQPQEAKQLFEEALALDQRLRDMKSQALDRVALGRVALAVNDLSVARSYFAAALDMQRAQRDVLALAATHREVSELEGAEGNFDAQVSELLYARVGFALVDATDQLFATDDLLHAALSRVGADRFDAVVSDLRHDNPPVAYGLGEFEWRERLTAASRAAHGEEGTVVEALAAAASARLNRELGM